MEQRQSELMMKAAKILGSRIYLAEALKCSNVMVGLLLNEKSRVSAEMALRIHEATKGKIRAEELRPDLPWYLLKKGSLKRRGAEDGPPIK